MHNYEKEFWKEVIELIQNSKYAHIHKTYDSGAGWANLSYKGKRFYITYEITWSEIIEILDKKLTK
jgi:hypothetical protein